MEPGTPEIWNVQKQINGRFGTNMTLIRPKLLIASIILAVLIGVGSQQYLSFGEVKVESNQLPVISEMLPPSACDFAVIGHRGNSYRFPEDTALSVDKAFDVGASITEVDVRLSKDGVPVLMHDLLIDRTTNGSGRVDQWTIAMLKTLDAGSWKGEQFAGIKVTTLAEAIKAAAGRGPLYLDIKSAGLAKPIAKVLKENNFPPDSIYPAVQSNQMLMEYHRVLPNTPIIWFRTVPKNWGSGWLDYLKANGVVALEYFWPTIEEMPKGKQFINLARKKGLSFWTYVINDVPNMKKVMAAGINGIETDRPEILHKLVCNKVDQDMRPIPRVMGQWNFEKQKLNGSPGSNLRFWGKPDKNNVLKFGTTVDFSLPAIHGEFADVIFIPSFSSNQGLQMFPGFHHFGPGSGSRMNTYSVIFDLLRPKSSERVKQALLQTNENNRNEAELYISESGEVGSLNNTVGFLPSDEWHRLAFVVDLTEGVKGKIRLYLDGLAIGEFDGDGIDGHYSAHSNLNSRRLLLFTDNTARTAPLYVSSIQVRDYAISQTEAFVLGAAKAGGISKQRLLK